MDNLKTNNWLTNWMVDRIADSTQYQKGTRTPEATGWAGALGGALGFDTKSVARQRNKDVQNTEALDYLDSLGITPDELGIKPGALTKSSAATAVREYKDEKDKGKLTEQRTHEAGIRQEGYTRKDKQISADHRRQDSQIAANHRRQDSQFAHTSKESALDRALTRDLDLSSNNMQMQMKFMDMDLADKRMDYDRETRRMDKRDRAIASLMSGIGQLGGAFAA